MDILELKASNDSLNVAHHPWEHARFSVVYDIVKKNLSIPELKNIVDLGCGDTFFMEKLHQKITHTELHGIDIAFDEQTLDVLQKKYKGKNIHLYSSYNGFLRKDITPDLILLLDVIEHIKDDYGFMLELLNSSSLDKSNILITVPAFESLTTTRDEWLGHYRRYTVRSLTDLLVKSGFEVLKKGYFFSSLLIPRYLQKLVEKFKSPKKDELSGIGNYKAKPFFDTIMKNAMVIDYKITRPLYYTGIHIPGLSCFALCKKK